MARGPPHTRARGGRWSLVRRGVRAVACPSRRPRRWVVRALARVRPCDGASVGGHCFVPLSIDRDGCGGRYNEMGFRVLDLLGPVSQAVANSAKRVVILFAAVVFLGEQVEMNINSNQIKSNPSAKV